MLRRDSSSKRNKVNSDIHSSRYYSHSNQSMLQHRFPQQHLPLLQHTSTRGVHSTRSSTQGNFVGLEDHLDHTQLHYSINTYYDGWRALIDVRDLLANPSSFIFLYFHSLIHSIDDFSFVRLTPHKTYLYKYR